MTFATWRDACLSAGTPSNKEKVRSQATEIFAFLSKHVEHLTPENVVIKTKSSHNEALAQLIQELGPAFSGAPYVSRICALHCICGAIDGCSSTGLSYKIMEALGSFFLAQCGPIEPEEGDEEDSDEQVRDAAVMSLSVLVRAKVQETADDDDPVARSIQLRLDLAQKGVERRCAAPEMDEMEYDHGYDFPATTSDIRGGLSTLPRSRRSLCFDLVRAAIDGLPLLSDDSLGESSVTSYLASYASFAANCLHGESDPRCLMQLLQMLNAMQRGMLPFFQPPCLVAFPILAVFDAVAPYYPIQFTPPPNDVHGISRQGLHASLMAILCFTDFDPFASGHDTMLNLSAGIFLERLMPLDASDGTPPSTVDDKLEAIQDLTVLLFRETGSLCDQLGQDTVREMSSALLTTHTEAASGVASGGKEGQKYKELADACRTLVTKVAFALEVSSQDSLWNIFVAETVRSRSTMLSTSPQSAQGRSSVAYLACLSASGGPRTLSLCFQSCLPPLLDILCSERNDQEKLAAAAYSAGAFFSSFEVAVSRGLCDGVELHPHPLEPFSAKAVHSLCALMGIQDDAVDGAAGTIQEVQPEVRVAAIRCLDSVLTVTPSTLLKESELKKVCTVIESLVGLVETTEDVVIENSDIDGAEVALKKAASQMIGSLLGRFSDEESDYSSEPSSLDCVLRDFLRDDIFVRLLASSARAHSREDIEVRLDWMALAYCCQVSQNAAGQVVASIVNSLNDALAHQSENTANQGLGVHYAMCLCFIIHHGGTHASSAFRMLSAPNASPMDILVSLSSMSPTSQNKAKSRAADEARVSRLSTLMLPPTSEDQNEVEGMVWHISKASSRASPRISENSNTFCLHHGLN